MKIEYLECFQAVEKYRSFSKAAESLYIAQSSLSKKIRALEEILGGTLFIRKGNSVISLSPFGEYIANHINNLMEDYDILLKATDDYRLNYQKKLRLGAFLNIAHSGIIKPVTDFEAGRENFYIETLEREHSRLRQSLVMGQLDVCFGYYELIGDMDNYEVIPLFSDELLLITNKDLKKQNNWGCRINLLDAKNITFCFPREDMELFSFLISTCRSFGFIPQLTNSDVRLGTIRQYISSGMRCTLQFESISRSKFYTNQFEFIYLENAPRLTMVMYRDSKHSKKRTVDFSNHIINWYKDDPRHVDYCGSRFLDVLPRK